MIKQHTLIGLVYVYLPLTISQKFNVIGFDISSKRIVDLRPAMILLMKFFNEISNKNLIYTSSLKDIARQAYCIKRHQLILTMNQISSLFKMLQKCKGIKKNDLVIYESTVYPGMTREI